MKGNFRHFGQYPWREDAAEGIATNVVFGRFGKNRTRPMNAEPADLQRDESGRWRATAIFPELGAWWQLIARLEISDDDAVTIAAAAQRNRTTFAAEAVALGYASEERIVSAVSDHYGFPAQSVVDPATLALSEEQASMLLRQKRHTTFAKITEGTRGAVLVASDCPSELAYRVKLFPDLAKRVRFVSARALRTAVESRVSGRMMEAATFGLCKNQPALSARVVVNAWQGCILGMLGVGLPLAFWCAPVASFVALHAVSTLFFLACVVLRIAAIAAGKRTQAPPLEPADTSVLPVYSVLVALYRESNVVAGLIAALDRLDWPKSKLDIKLVCESDDHVTIEAILAARPPAHMQVVRVPFGAPRTKPKALNYALQLCRGEFVVLYDAEDRPHRSQLMEAWQRFQRCGPDVACLQSPLAVGNGANSWIARLFAFEYTALFEGLLPWLSGRRLLLPLGGTSNHFRRAALDEVGAWDPFNVTEDADLGVRMARCGYRTETLDLPTLEDGPETRRVWLPQRTRWFKGWAQTWLVHMRDPAAFMRDIGLPSFLIVQILFLGMLVSSLIHPVFVATILTLLVDLALGRPFGTIQSAFLVADIANISLGYVSFWLLGWQSALTEERHDMGRIVLFTPLYWLMMSWAAWRAVLHLYWRPHLWEKTPHGAEARAAHPRRPAEGGAAILQPIAS